MLLLAALAAFSAAPAERPAMQARVTVRIERPARASAKQWDSLPLSGRREILIRDDQGRPVLIRLIENE